MGPVINELETAIVQRAKALGWELERLPTLEEIANTHSDTLLRALDPSQSHESMPLPYSRRAYLLRGSARLLLAGLDEDTDFMEFCGKALWWSGVIRGSLPAVYRADLHLFIGISPTRVTPGLLRDCSRIEADERICRKHVWLRQQGETAEAFLDTTLLADPWRSEAATPRSLDPLQRLVESAGVSATLAASWVAALSAVDGTKSDEIAETLVRIHESAHDE